MKLSDGYTGIPKKFIDHMAKLTAVELKVAISLFLQLRLMKHESQINNGEVVTTLQKIREYAGYDKDDYTITEIGKIVSNLKDKHVLTWVEVREYEVRCIFSQTIITGRGFVAIYNKRLLKGKDRLKDAELRVFIILLSYGQHKQIKVLEEFIGKKADISLSTVQRAIVKLRERGLISFEKEDKKVVSKRNIYTLIEYVDVKKIKALNTTVVAEEEHIGYYDVDETF